MDENTNLAFWKGQLFEIVTMDKEVYFTQVMQHQSDLFVQRPVNEKNVPLRIEDGMPITVYFHDDHNGLQMFPSTIHLLENNKVLIKKPAEHSIEKAQRRRYFRVQVAIEMRLVLPSSPNSNSEETLTVHTHDISGGGVSFLYREQIVEKGDIVQGVLALKKADHVEEVHFKSKVVSVRKHPNKLLEIALQFIDMNESVRSEIIRFCIFKQIELRNKVLGSRLG